MNASPDPLSPPPSRVRYGVLALACSLSLITYLDRICIMRARPDIQTSLGFTVEQMGLVFGAFSLGYLLFEVPGGWMGDRWGSRRILTRIVLWWSIFTALTGCIFPFEWATGISIPWGEQAFPLALNSLGLMLLVRFLFGAGEAGAYPNLTRVISDWFPFHERGFAQGSIWMAARFGGAIAPLVIGRLAATFGWRYAFLILGLVGILWVILFRRWFHDRPEHHPDCNDQERELIRAGRPASQPHAADGHTWPGFATLARSLTIWALCSAGFWVCVGWYFYPTWQPKYLEDVFGVRSDATQSELLTGLPFLCGAVGCLVGGRLSDRLVARTGSKRWGRSLVGLIGFGGAGFCVLATGFVTEWWQAVALLCLAFLINDLAVPVIWATSADVGGRFAGSVSGLMNMIGAIGAMLSPLLIPVALTYLPESYTPVQRWQTIFIGLSSAWFLAGLSWLFIDAGTPIDGPASKPQGA
ncbi:MAG: MFS transporter [Gemmataceae bacterium]